MKKLRHIVSLLHGLIRELSDQNAYERFLAGRGTVASASEWRTFADRRHAARFERPKCC